MNILITILIIQLLIYVAMIVWSYFDLSNDKKEGNIHSVTIRKVFSYWIGVCYIPIFGPLCLLTIFIVFGLDELKEWFIKTKFYNKFQNFLDKEL